MKSWRKWGMRALALAMLLSLSTGPLAAVPRGGHSSGDEILDLVDGPGSEYFGDPDTPGTGLAPQSPAEEVGPSVGEDRVRRSLHRSLPESLLLALRMLLQTRGWSALR